MSVNLTFVSDEDQESSSLETEDSSNESSDGADSDTDPSSKESTPAKSKKQQPIRKRISAPVDDSSDDEDDDDEEDENQGSLEESVGRLEESVGRSEESEDSDIEEIVPPRKSQMFNRTLEPESSDDEEKKRRSLNLADSTIEEHIKFEEQAFSKATRRSIMGYEPRSSIIPNSDTSDESVIIEETEDEADGDMNPTHSSTMRSPMKDISNSYTTSPQDVKPKVEKESSLLQDEAAGGVPVLTKVSPSVYQSAVAEKEKLTLELDSLLKMQKMVNTLPDGGMKLKQRIASLKEKISLKNLSIQSMEVDENLSIKNEITKSFQSSRGSESIVSINDSDIEIIPSKPIPSKLFPVIDLAKVDDVVPQFTGKVGMSKFNAQKALTVDSLEQMKDSVNTRPDETVLAVPPKHLKVELMKHQLHALAFMVWREAQKPRGGFLADDMGLGKTLTTISLILKQLQDREECEEESDSSDEDEANDDGWKGKGRRDLRKGGTLIICPASLVEQWGAEIKSKTKRGALDFNIFHGPKRIYKARELAKYDVIITSYQTAVAEKKNDGCLYQIKWNRVVLDEGHVIRNHKSKQTEAICSFVSKNRWVLTGTPIHNKEFDIYSSIKFLKCQPFDDLSYWKRFIEIKGQRSSPRVQLLLKTILLRRTKDQLVAAGDMNSLPVKKSDLVYVKLNNEERFVYNKVMAFSQAIFASFLQQHQDKNDNFDYDKNKLGRVYQKFARRFNVNREVKAHEILTLLLRLRQVCCHPGLIKQMLDRGDISVHDIDDEKQHESMKDEDEVNILSQMEKLSMEDDGSEEDHEKRWSLENEVFNMDIASSKIEKLMDVLRETVMKTDEKAIIVSQWTSYLSIIRGMLEVEGVTYCELNGTVAVKDRNDIVVNFNNPNSGVKVMLLSLTAGGVGLNLVGANILFLMDLHWNPQLEQQAQDRIYRYGQDKNVVIYKFVCSDTLEERIYKIQQEKLAVAAASLTGSKTKSGTKLTINDMKALFDMA